MENTPMQPMPDSNTPTGNQDVSLTLPLIAAAIPVVLFLIVIILMAVGAFAFRDYARQFESYDDYDYESLFDDEDWMNGTWLNEDYNDQTDVTDTYDDDSYYELLEYLQSQGIDIQ